MGIRNDVYSVRLGDDVADEVSQGVNNSPFIDDLTLALDFTSAISTLSVDSTAFDDLDGSLSSNIGAVDFSLGGSVEITKASLDQNEIQIDSFSITPVPEPTSSMLIFASAGIYLLRRKRA